MRVMFVWYRILRRYPYCKTCKSFKSLFYSWLRSEEILVKGKKNKKTTLIGFVWALVSPGTWETLRWIPAHKNPAYRIAGTLNHSGYWLFFFLHLCCFEGLGRTAEVRLWGPCVYWVTGRGRDPIEPCVLNLIKVMDCGKCKMWLVRRWRRPMLEAGLIECS